MKEDNVSLIPSRVDETMSRKEILKKLCATGLPLSLIGSMRTGESFFIARFLSEYGENALAIDGLLSLYMTFLMTSNSVLINTIPTSMICNSYGEGNKEEVGRIVKQTWVLATGLSVPIIISLCVAEPILNALGQPRELTSIVGTYARVISPAVPALLTNMVDINFLKSISREYDLIPYQVLSVGIGIGASYIFILGKLGAEPQGAVGIGYALTLQAWIIFLAAKGYFYLKQEFKPYKLFTLSLGDLKHLRKMTRFGAPLWGLSWVENGSNFTIGLMVGWLGTSRIAVNQAISLHLKIFNMISDGIKQSNQICVSHTKGKKKYKDMEKFSYTAITLIAGVNILPIFLFSSIPYPLAQLFVSEETLSEVESHLRIIFVSKALANIFDSLKGSLSDNLNTLYDTYYPTFIQILFALAVTLPLSYVLAFACDLDLSGLNFAASIGIGSSIPILSKRLYRKNNLLLCQNGSETAEPIDTLNSNPNVTVRLEVTSIPTSPANQTQVTAAFDSIDNDIRLRAVSVLDQNSPQAQDSQTTLLSNDPRSRNMLFKYNTLPKPSEESFTGLLDKPESNPTDNVQSSGFSA